MKHLSITVKYALFAVLATGINIAVQRGVGQIVRGSLSLYIVILSGTTAGLIVKYLLEEEGFEVTTAKNGAECFSALEYEKPDLILLDLMMPGMAGEDVCKKIRQNPGTERLKIAILSVVKPSDSTIKMLKKLGILDYITKPFEKDEFIERVKRIA